MSRIHASGRIASWRLAALTTASIFALAAQSALAQEVADEDEPTTQEEAEEADPGAQTAPPLDDSENVITVTGFREALKNAQDIKQNADTFVDVITAEDIGALPDRSVAEALQRVPGVNISRFEQRNDPDRFSVEGSGVIIRGLPFVRSELNGRDVFSANGGRSLSFNDISPELLGRIEVYKNVTADMIEGALAGTVNLVTRKPLDNYGLHLAGTLEANYGDMAKEWSPGFSLLGSNTFETGIGTFGLQFGYAQSELVTKTDASQITDPCYREATLDGPCLRIRPVTSAGVGPGFNYDPENFPPEGAVVVPKGAGVRTTDITRDRQAYSGVLQWESLDGAALVTLEYLRAETQSTLDEYAALALVNDDLLFPVPADEWTFADGIFQTGTLTQSGGLGIPTELLRFQRNDDAMTEDFSLDVDLAPTDRLRFNIELQHIKSDRTEEGLITAMQTYSDLFIDNSGATPIVQFLQPGTDASPADYFNDPSRTFHWFLIDNQVRNEGKLTTMRADVEYDVSDTGFLKQVRFGARWGDRNRVTRNANFANWGNLGAPWTGRNGNWNCDDAQAFGCGGAYVTDFPEYSEIRSPFGDGFQRGNVPIPFGDGSAFFFGGDDLVGEYLSGMTQEQAAALAAFTLTPNPWTAIYNRANVVPGTPWVPAEISDVDEITDAFYARADFGTEFSNGWIFEGNVGLRYVKTKVRSQGEIQFPIGTFFDAPIIDANGNNVGGNNDGVVQVSEVTSACARTVPGQSAPGYCGLSPARTAEFAATYTGETIDDDVNIGYSEWLPSINMKLEVGGGLLFRAAVSKGIARPDLNAYASGGVIFDNTGALRDGGTLETGPLFAIGTGNRFLRPTKAWNYDLSAEWYFDDVGSLTVSGFYKDISAIVNGGQVIRTITSPSGITRDIAYNTSVNIDEGKLKGVELAYQQTYDFLPGPLSGLGAQLVYTYVDSSAAGNSQLGAEQSPFTQELPLVGVSKHTVNAVAFYELGPISARAAYNWRSDFLQTPRDVIFPFSPIYGESTGQLDGSIFFTVNEHLKLGVQGVNLLDEVTRTSQVIDFDGTRVTRSAFRNDRRYTVMARFSF